MKRILALILVVIQALSLTACGSKKSDAAKAVDEQISAIGEVTLESEAQISAAETAVEALHEEDKEQLDNLNVLTEARNAYNTLILDDEASEIEAAIAAIGTVTIDSEAAISAAEEAYSNASPEVQALVENTSVLEAATDALSGLRIAKAEKLISAIGEVTLERADAIRQAQDVYNALSATDKKKVSNTDVLDAATTRLKELAKAEAEQLLAGMRLDEDKVQKMQFYTPKVIKFYSDGSWAADIRCFVVPYLGRDTNNNVWLRLICNYTGDDWVFWKKLIFAVDDERYTKTFSYYDIVRNNDGGIVWEYIDTDVSDSDVEMLWAIANSTETIVRFEGDDYTHDFTVNSDDKQAIRDVLTAYEALK